MFISNIHQFFKDYSKRRFLPCHWGGVHRNFFLEMHVFSEFNTAFHWPAEFIAVILVDSQIITDQQNHARVPLLALHSNYSWAFHLISRHGFLENISQHARREAVQGVTEGQSLNHDWSSSPNEYSRQRATTESTYHDRVTESLHLNLSFYSGIRTGVTY